MGLVFRGLRFRVYRGLGFRGLGFIGVILGISSILWLYYARLCSITVYYGILRWLCWGYIGIMEKKWKLLFT